MQVVVISNLYPNSLEPTRGIYTQQLVLQLSKHVNIRVIAPLPWRPKLVQELLGQPQAPLHECREGIDVWHPRYCVIPKTARFTYGASFFLGIYSTLKRLHAEQKIDLINVHWAYPDAVGVVYAARQLAIPVVVHALGCDINEFAQYPGRRQQVAWALRQSTINVYVSQGLADEARALGVSHDRNQVILNGVDQTKFKPGDKMAVRRQLELPIDQKIVLFAGNFNIEKGLIDLINAWQKVQQADLKAVLVIIGSGPEEAKVRQRIHDLALTQTIMLLGRQPHDKVPSFLQATDILCLPSLREGCPNIVLEALSSGAAVIGSKVGAVPELVGPDRGLLVPPRDVAALSDALIQGLQTQFSSQPWSWMSWADNSMKVLEVYREAVKQ